jgi:hypothetical protein
MLPILISTLIVALFALFYARQQARLYWPFRELGNDQFSDETKKELSEKAHANGLAVCLIICIGFALVESFYHFNLAPWWRIAFRMFLHFVAYGLRFMEPSIRLSLYHSDKSGITSVILQTVISVKRTSLERMPERKALDLPFNYYILPTHHQNIFMTTREILIWIHVNLRPFIDRAIDQAKQKNPGLLYTPEWLVGMTYRETGGLINKYGRVGTKPEIIHSLMRGDFSKRPGEKEASYHGYGYMQIDIGSFPEFVKSGDWKDPFKTYLKAISVLDGKLQYIEQHFPRLGGDDLHRAITAAYNCGEGNVVKVLTAGNDIDSRTADHNYSLDVWQKRSFYRQILQDLNPKETKVAVKA